MFTQTTFGPKTYLAITKTNLPFSEASNKQMYEEAGQKLGTYMSSHSLTPTGPWTVIYFTWDMEHAKTDMAITFPIDGLESVDDAEFTVVSIPQTHAIMMELVGSYSGLSDAHMKTSAELVQQGHTYSEHAVAVEEYIVDSMHESDESKLKTNIYHLYK